MGFHDDGDDRKNLGPPPEMFRLGSVARDRRPPAGALRWVGLAAAAVVAFLLLDTLKSIYVEVLWFTSVGFGAIYKTVVLWQVVLFFTGMVTTVAAVGANIWLARRLAPRGSMSRSLTKSTRRRSGSSAPSSWWRARSSSG